MGRRRPRLKLRQNGWIEALEKRIVMSTDMAGGLLDGNIDIQALFDRPIHQHGGSAIEYIARFDNPFTHHAVESPNFHLGSSGGDVIDPASGYIDKTLVSAHGITGLLDVRNNYGFTGASQTVVVIDSGIAYDHLALGGGFGTGYRVVGGWDFTDENDDDPYDDGPTGSHGTHVAGIIGAYSGSTNSSGVAPGVDLVALRIFDDNGDGYFNWVEDALQWVHTHRHDFENPITAINLSLGTDWNSGTIPSWAMLEDEFAQLESDGIFISVSAGNSFTTYDEPGLSYPAASSYVIPVMATDDSGNLCYFSQRHERAIAAPGRWITSTVPDYVGDQNGINDDWASFSGTSMAAPYVAGASVLIREAMEFIGLTNITQDIIYDQIRNTADIIYDTATNQNYHRLNLSAAIDSLMPADDYGSTVESAFDLGTLDEYSTISGLLGTLDDCDFFTFTSGINGTVTFEATRATHRLAANWQLDGGSGIIGGDHCELFTFDVTSGQTYTVGFTSSDGIGYYDLGITAEASFNPIDWGIITFNQQHGIANDAETWYQIQSHQAGFLTAEAFFQHADGDIDLEFFNSKLELIDSSTTTEDWERVDFYAGGSDTFYVRVVGTNSEIDFRISNLVFLENGTACICGTAGDDAFTFEGGPSQIITINGVMYNFDFGNVTAFQFEGGIGIDSISLTGTENNEIALLHVGQIELIDTNYSVIGQGFENITVEGGGGYDTISFYDSEGDDTFTATPTSSRLQGDGFDNIANNFDAVFAYSTYGNDVARFYDSAGDDLFRAWNDQAVMKGQGYYNLASGFVQTYAYSTCGNDVARFYDSAGDDLYRAWNDQAVMKGQGYYNLASGFSQTYANSTRGKDVAQFFDSAGNDLYRAWSGQAVMSGMCFYNYAGGFCEYFGFSSNGTDRAILYDSSHNDRVTAQFWGAYIQGGACYRAANGFVIIEAHGINGGNNTSVVEAVDYLFSLVGDWN